MKSFIVLVLGLVMGSTATAKLSLEDAFKKAVLQSELEKSQARIKLDIEKDSWKAAWHRGSNPKVVKVETSILDDVPQTTLLPPQQVKDSTAISAERALKEELSDYN